MILHFPWAEIRGSLRSDVRFGDKGRSRSAALLDRRCLEPEAPLRYGSLFEACVASRGPPGSVFENNSSLKFCREEMICNLFFKLEK